MTDDLFGRDLFVRQDQVAHLFLPHRLFSMEHKGRLSTSRRFGNGSRPPCRSSIPQPVLRLLGPLRRMDQGFPMQDPQDLRRRGPAREDQLLADDDLFPERDGEEDAEEGDAEGPGEEGTEGQDERLGAAVELGGEHSESWNDSDETGGEGQSARRDGSRLQDDLQGVSIGQKSRQPG